MDEKYGSVMSWTMSDSVEERPRAIAWAAAFGAYRSSSAAARTRSRSVALTVRSLLPLMARDAVDKETPAALATSLSVTTPRSVPSVQSARPRLAAPGD